MEGRFRRAAAQLRAGQPDAALTSLDALIAEAPSHAPAFHARGLALFALGRRDEALDAFRQCVTRSPLAACSWASIADITADEADRIDAIEGVADARLIRARDAGVSVTDLVEAASALLDARRPARAVRLLSFRRQACRDNPRIARTLARAYYHAGAFRAAFGEARRLLQFTVPSVSTPACPAGHLDPARAGLVLAEIQALLAAAGADSFLVAGTLLGFHRTGAPLRHDRDIDLGVLARPDGGPDIAGILRAHPEILLPRITRPGDRYIGLIHRGVAVDIFLHDPAPGGITCGFSRLPGDIQWRFSPFTLTTRTYGGRSWRVPDQPERYLSETYGTSWQTPDTGFASAVSSPALWQADPAARAFYAAIRAARALAAGDREKAENLAAQSPIPFPIPPPAPAELPPPTER